MAADKIRVGIIGANAHYGWSMRAHLPALRALPDYELTAVCTSRPETAAESAAHYGARLAFHDYHAMVTHPDIDLVSVSVRVPLHHDMVMAALHASPRHEILYTGAHESRPYPAFITSKRSHGGGGEPRGMRRAGDFARETIRESWGVNGMSLPCGEAKRVG